jgi:hypothetical protein
VEYSDQQIRERMASIFKMIADKIGKKMFSDFNKNWYLGLFWSEELVDNDEICIQGHFYEATIFKMAANKIVKLSMVSDFNEHLYLGVSWSEELVGNNETCIHMPEFWYGGRLGTYVFASKHNQTSLCIAFIMLPFLWIVHSWLLSLTYFTCRTIYSVVMRSKSTLDIKISFDQRLKKTTRSDSLQLKLHVLWFLLITVVFWFYIWFTRHHMN